MGMRQSYLELSLECCLDEMGLFGTLTNEQIKELAEALEVSLENEGTATGRDSIPNPLEAQMREQANRLNSEIARQERASYEREQDLLRTISSLRSRIYDLQQQVNP